MAKTSFNLDTKDFDIKFGRITGKTIPHAASQGFMLTGALVIRDSIKEVPRAPHITGHLWRSQKIEKPKIESGEISIELGFNADYATAVHEMPSPYKDPTMAGSGPKFLEAKLIKNKEKYMKKIADEIKEAGGK